MKLRFIKFWAKTEKGDIVYRFRRKMAFFSRYRSGNFPKMRVLVAYTDDKGEYPKGTRLENDSGWYTDKNELLKTVKIFLEECE